MASSFRFARRLLLGTTIAGTASLAAVVKATPQVSTVPKNSLLATDRAATSYADAFQLHMPLPSPPTPDASRVPTIDAFASAFERCFLFSLERKLLFAAGIGEPGRTDQALPYPAPGSLARFKVGQPVSTLWTVSRVVRDESLQSGEVILTYNDTLGVGATWLKVEPVEDKNKVRLMFGSSLDSSKTGKTVADKPWVVIELHKLYSRLLLVNAAGQLWWDLKKESARQ